MLFLAILCACTQHQDMALKHIIAWDSLHWVVLGLQYSSSKHTWEYNHVWYFLVEYKHARVASCGDHLSWIVAQPSALLCKISADTWNRTEEQDLLTKYKELYIVLLSILITDSCQSSKNGI